MMTSLFSPPNGAAGVGLLDRLRDTLRRLAGNPDRKDVLPVAPDLALTTAIAPDRDFLRRLAGSKEAGLNLARDFIRSAVPCTCIEQPQMLCPQCAGRLELAMPDGPVASEEFNAAKAGDVYCETCKGDEANSGFKYFWLRDLPRTKRMCQRCMTLEVTAVPGSVLAALENEWVKTGLFWRDAAETAYRELGQATETIRHGTEFCAHVAAISWKPYEPNTQVWLDRLWELGLAFQKSLEGSQAVHVWESRPRDLFRNEEGN